VSAVTVTQVVHLIRDILEGSGSGIRTSDKRILILPFFVSDLQDANKNNTPLPFEGTLTSFFKDTKSKRSHKTVEIKVFLTIFA
jgi:hypothetical protein